MHYSKFCPGAIMDSYIKMDMRWEFLFVDLGRGMGFFEQHD